MDNEKIKKMKKFLEIKKYYKESNNYKQVIKEVYSNNEKRNESVDNG